MCEVRIADFDEWSAALRMNRGRMTSFWKHVRA